MRDKIPIAGIDEKDRTLALLRWVAPVSVKSARQLVELRDLSKVSKEESFCSCMEKHLLVWSDGTNVTLQR